jgi:P-type conjugative transfer protein TrbJ
VNKRKYIIVFTFMMHLILNNCMASGLPVIDAAALIQMGEHLKEMQIETRFLEKSLLGLKDDQYKWSNAQKLINTLGQTIQDANGIAYTADNRSVDFQRAYPGYKAPENYSQQYRENINRTQNTLGGTLQSIGLSAKDFEDENARLNFLQAQSKNAQGQTQAIQASAQIASEMVSQIQLLRQTLIAQTNAETAYYAQQVQAEASSQAMLEEVISAGSTDVPEYGSSGNYLKVPKF